MADREKQVFCFLLVSLLFRAHGLELSMDIDPGNEVCGHLKCWNDVIKDGNVFTILEVSIYDVTKEDSKIKLASVTNEGAHYIDQTKHDHVNGTGTISRYHADLTLDFGNETDCLYGSFQCELKYVNMSGQVDVTRTTITPDDLRNTSHCAIISYELTKLNVHSEKLQKELNELRLNNSLLEDELNELRLNNTLLEDEMFGLRYNNTVLEGELKMSQQQGNKPTGCERGVTHSRTRETFLLWGTIRALCDTDTDGGGWTIIQRRTKGDVDFYRGWSDYKKGFGTPDTDFWIGNDVIHNLTSQGYTELRVDMELDGHKYFAHYSHFSVGDEVSKYKLSVSGYSGTANDSLTYQDGMKFSTYDQDNDPNDFNSCAQEWEGAWWYKICMESNLNGAWGKTNAWRGLNSYSLSLTEMKVRLSQLTGH